MGMWESRPGAERYLPQAQFAPPQVHSDPAQQPQPPSEQHPPAPHEARASSGRSIAGF
jgi:hypothetical protein